jgi:hypothetical protein
MHISIGAAILIIGLLYLATIPAGRKVLGVAFLVIVGGGGSLIVLANHNFNERVAQMRVEDIKQAALQTERNALCEKRYPINDTGIFAPGQPLAGFYEDEQKDCKDLHKHPNYPY